MTNVPFDHVVVGIPPEFLGRSIWCRIDRQEADDEWVSHDDLGLVIGDVIWSSAFVVEIEKDELSVIVESSAFLPPAAYFPRTGHCCVRDGDLLREGDKDIATSAMAAIIGIFDIIETSSRHPVEVINTTPRRSMNPRNEKPWTREDLRTVILMDLSEARKYGHRVDRGGSHASPIPHTRRGHYATLRHEKWKHNPDGSPRQVWVKPAWVGDTEWIFEGRQYRVIDTGASTPESKLTEE